ncbi:hypothetical protein [Streptomyces sp. NPDC059701]|uniref:hypothetical protein n=1 Tax=Streptomyces sp. NPDC059701 TaxID=3346914 RepID=UPI0036813D06
MSSRTATTGKSWPRRPGVRLGAAVAVLLSVATGCSDGGRDYAVPKDLCGVEVGSDLLAPFLPDGEKVAQRAYDAGDTSPRCRVTVDDRLILYVADDLVPPDTDPLKVQDRALLRLGNPAPVDVGEAARVANRGATAVAGCTRDGAEKKFVTLLQLERSTPEDTEQRRSALTDLLRAYSPKAMADLGCAPK